MKLPASVLIAASLLAGCCNAPGRPQSTTHADLGEQLLGVSGMLISVEDGANKLWNVPAEYSEFAPLRAVGARGEELIPDIIKILDDERPTLLHVCFSASGQQVTLPVRVNSLATYCLEWVVLGSPKSVMRMVEGFETAYRIQESRRYKELWQEWWAENRSRPREEWKNSLNLGE